MKHALHWPVACLPARGLRSGWIALAGSLCLWVAAPAFAAQPATPDPALVRQVRDAQQTMERLAGLEEQAGDTRAAADRLAQAGRDALIAWQGYLRADERGRTAFEQARDCLPPLQQRLAANNAALAARAQAVTRSQAAVRAVASAEGGGLAPAAHLADLAFQQRRAAEMAFAERHRAVSEQARVCAGDTLSAHWAIQGTQDHAQEAVDLARDLAPQLAALRTRWQATSEAFLAATQAGLVEPAGAAPTIASDEPLKRLEQALAGTGLPARSGAPTAVLTGPLTPNRVNLERLTAELERLQDAAAYIDLSTASPLSDCVDASCAGLLAERRGLTARMTDTQAQLAQAVDQWRQSPASLREQLAPLLTRRQSLNVRMQPMASTLGPAVTETTAASRAVQAAAVQLQSAAERAHEHARQAWELAYQQAYGQAPEPDLDVATASGMGMAGIAPAPSAAMLRLEIRSHAYELFSRFDGEIADFGAYTYVLVRSASDLQTPAVRQRFLQLLHILQTLPAAGLVASGDKPHVNVFCIPVTPGNEGVRDAGQVAYASDLGQQLKMRAQNGLLTQKAVRQRLTSAPGPFLVTVPGRLALAQSGAPLLLADLSTYPPDAIADLTNHYMNGLVDDFPRQQALWTPPVLQRVALFMIHLAAGTGELVTSALPTAQAQPR
ncbi:hypothetical protein [Hydrogenophaga sp.]|uniref:hypothetical protein n=1 Tax=Hydrogenophaga sp. TaxID=1904254 RepID=UPI00286D9BC9|nr:hypothetical protein [Hydrogenophaga sp.]